ncbi:MAG: hypothetical protein RSC10_04315 [Longicatena sp.]
MSFILTLIIIVGIFFLVTLLIALLKVSHISDLSAGYDEEYSTDLDEENPDGA